MCRNKQQSIESSAALGAGVDHQRRILVIIELSLIEVVVLLRRDLALLLAPQRDHAVEGGLLPNGLIFGLFGGIFSIRHRLGAVLRHQKGDGVADIVGIFFHQLGKAVFLQEFAVLFVLGIVLEVQRYPRAGNSHFARLDGVALCATGFPATAGCFAPCAAFHRYMVSHHKGGIEPHAELSDDLDLLAGLVFPLKIQTAALGDGTQIFLHFLGGHAAAVIGDGKQAVLLIHRQRNFIIAAGKGYSVIGQRAEIQLVNGIAGIADQLSQKNLLVGIDGVDHHVQ